MYIYSNYIPLSCYYQARADKSMLRRLERDMAELKEISASMLEGRGASKSREGQRLVY